MPEISTLSSPPDFQLTDIIPYVRPAPATGQPDTPYAASISDFRSMLFANGTNITIDHSTGSISVTGVVGTPGSGSTINAYQDGTLVTAAPRPAINAIQSLKVADDAANSRMNLSLQSDSASPGNYKFYGTNASGVKGWQDFASTYVAMSGSILRGHISGLKLSNDATSPNTVLNVSEGQAADSSAVAYISPSTTFFKSVGGTWTAGAGTSGSPVNGMGTGLTVAANTWYHVFAILKSGSPDVFFDTSVTAAHAPAGTTAYRRIGSFKTDGSAHILPFKSAINGADRFFYWATQTQDYTGSASTSLTQITLNVPPGVVVRPLGRFMGVASSSGVSYLVFSSGMETDVSPGGNATTAPGSDAQVLNGTVVVPLAGQYQTDTSQRIAYRANAATGGSVGVHTRGWIDNVGIGQ